MKNIYIIVLILIFSSILLYAKPSSNKTIINLQIDSLRSEINCLKEETYKKVIDASAISVENANAIINYVGVFATIFGVIITLAGIYIAFESNRTNIKREQAQKDYITTKKLLNDIERKKDQFIKRTENLERDIENKLFQTRNKLDSVDKHLDQINKHNLTSDCELSNDKKKYLMKKDILVENIELLTNLIKNEPKMSTTTQSKNWPEDRAILFVHGIGNVKPGDCDELIGLVKKSLGDQASRFAYYPLYYDAINDWFKEKTQLAGQIGRIVTLLKGKAGGDKLAETAADFGGDVIWPVLLGPAREAIRENYLLQLKQMVLDGNRAGIPPNRQKISIICHSLGCFHTYETIHYAANHPEHNLTPGDDGVRFANVIYMASPVQLIRTAARELNQLVPDGLAALDPAGLSCPWGKGLFNKKVYSVKNWISVTGELDPVGGYLFRKRLDWAYMNIPAGDGFGGQQSLIDRQSWLNIDTEAALMEALRAALDPNNPPDIQIKNPHSWEGYVQHHQEDLKKWLSA